MTIWIRLPLCRALPAHVVPRPVKPEVQAHEKIRGDYCRERFGHTERGFLHIRQCLK